ncbi:maestro heat-like repeat-containing protein family member 2B [Mergus octosetaceus]
MVVCPQGDRAQTYCELENVLWGDDSCLQCGVINRLLAEVSWDLTADQGVTEDTKMAASDVLVALARSHFSFVLAELLAQLNAPGKISKEFVLITVGKLLSTNALQCIPFMRVMLLGLRTVVGQLGSGRILRAACGALEQWAKVVNVYICTWKGCSLPATEKEQLYENLSQVFCSVARNWLDCPEEEDKQAVIGAMTPLMRVLLHKEEHREHVWEQLLWLLHQYRTVQDTSRVTKSLLYFLEALEQVEILIPKGKCLAISSVVYSELTDDTKEHSQDHKAELTQCILLQARICPEETILFLESQLGHEREAARVAALGLLGALARCDEPAMTEKLPQVVEAVKCVCRDPSIRVRRAVLHFIRELLSANAQSCSAWDVVGYIFSEFSQSSSRRAAGLLSAQEAQEEGGLQGLCMDVLGSLDISVRGMAKLLWPRLLIYVMPAKYTGMLIPLSRCLRALAERNELTAGREHQGLDPEVLNTLLQETTLTPHNLLARLLVVAGSPFAGSELQAAALLVMQSLHSRIHGAVGATWNTEIPLLLQYLQGGKENIPDSAEWERRLLQFLRASLETIGDDAWIKRLSCELSQRLDSSPSSSGEKAFLYKALGTTLGACQELPHVQENLLQHLMKAQPEEPSEAQGIISLICQAADSHFRLVLETLTTFAATSCSVWCFRVSRRRKVRCLGFHSLAFFHLLLIVGCGGPSGGCLTASLATQTTQASRRAEATCSAVMLAHSSMALRASKEQLLAHVEADIVGNILLLSISSSQPVALPPVQRVFFSLGPQNSQTNLALVQSILEVGCAVQAVGNLGSFHPVLKHKLLLILQSRVPSWWGGPLGAGSQWPWLGSRWGAATSCSAPVGAVGALQPVSGSSARPRAGCKSSPVPNAHFANFSVGLAELDEDDSLGLPGNVTAPEVSAHGHEGSGPAHGSPAQDKAKPGQLRRHRQGEYPWGDGESIPPVTSGDPASSGAPGELAEEQEPPAAMPGDCDLGEAKKWALQGGKPRGSPWLAAAGSWLQGKAPGWEQVLWLWLSSDNPWVCKRALQVCAQLLEDCRDGVAFQVRKDAHRVPPAPSPTTCKGAWKGSSAQLCTGRRVPQRYGVAPLPSPGPSRARVGDARECWGHLQPSFFLSPLQTRGAYLPFGALVGLLGPLTCEPTTSSRQLAAACLSSLLHIQAKATNRVLETDDPASLCEGLSARSDTSQQLQTSIQMAEIVCKNFPKEQAADFMDAILEPFRHARGSRVRAAGNWMLTFLETCGKDIHPDVQGILSVLHTCTESMLEPSFMYFVHRAVLILARHHEELTMNIILQKFVPMDRYMRYSLSCWGQTAVA